MNCEINCNKAVKAEQDNEGIEKCMNKLFNECDKIMDIKDEEGISECKLN